MNDDLSALFADVRREYDRRIETLRDLDRKALRGVRTSFVVIGVLVTGLSVADVPEPDAIHWLIPATIAFAVVCFLAAIVLGWITVNITDFKYGIGTSHRRDVLNDGDEADVSESIKQYDRYGRQIGAEIARNSSILSLMHATISLGVVAIVCAGGMYALMTVYDWSVFWAGLASVAMPLVSFALAVGLYNAAANGSIEQ